MLVFGGVDKDRICEISGMRTPHVKYQRENISPNIRGLMKTSEEKQKTCQTSR